MRTDVVTKLISVEPAYQARVHREVMQAKALGLSVSVRFDSAQFDGYTVYMMSDEELSSYESSGGLWTYIGAEAFLDNTSSFSY